MPDPISPERLAEIDIAIDMFRAFHPGSFGEMVGELRGELDRLAAELAMVEQAIESLDAPAWSDVTHARHVLRMRAEEATAAPTAEGDPA